jgi:hypothetical protein
MSAHVLTTVLTTLLAGWLMVSAGLGKRKLSWRRERKRRR